MPEHSENNECAGCDNCDFLPYDIFLMGVSTEIISSHWDTGIHVLSWIFVLLSVWQAVLRPF
ncbi:hypothetical protein, partial [Escherichia coli]|uniref:hypothetical protein n=1 Tax=Escherichia coli TaxID=562 RepID=UPI002931129F